MGRSNSNQPSATMETTDAWTEKDQAITVTEGNGFLYNLTLRAKVDSSPKDIYDILIDPNTVSIFRSIKECTYRRVLEDDGKGRRKLEVGHRAISRFLFINISFETHLNVWEDDVERTIKFQMARPGMMQKFDGCWRIKPFTQETLDSIYHPERVHPHPHHGGRLHHGPFNVSGLFSFLQPHTNAPEATESLVTLEQSILPRGNVPPGLKGLVRGLCAHQLRNMMEDLRKELQRRKDGTSTTVLLPKVPNIVVGPAAAGEHPGDKGKDGQGVKAGSCCASSSGKSPTAAVAPASASLALASRLLWDCTAPIHVTVRL